jgi:hypothetical protein
VFTVSRLHSPVLALTFSTVNSILESEDKAHQSVDARFRWKLEVLKILSSLC